jgi:hypothetical protein
MNPKTIRRIILAMFVVAYFPLKLYWISNFHPSLGLRLAVTGTFWFLLLGSGTLLERKRQSGSH